MAFEGLKSSLWCGKGEDFRVLTEKHGVRMRGFKLKLSVDRGLLHGGIAEHGNGPGGAVHTLSWEGLEFQHGESQSLV